MLTKDLRARIRELEAQVAALQLQVADQSTQLLANDATIAGLEARVQELEEALAECEEPPPNPVVAKPIVKGIFTRQGLPSAGTAVKTGTFPLYWSQVEQSPGVYDWSSLQNGLATARSRGHDSIRIRPFLGKDAPQWAKELADGPIFYENPHDNKTAFIPDIWSSEYQEAVERYLKALSSVVDDDDFVSLVFASGAMTYYAEPMQRGVNSATTRQNLLAAGYTIEKDLAAQRWQLDAMIPFKRTNIGLAYNGLQQIRADGTFSSSVVEMAKVMDYHISLFGPRTVLQNNSIRESYIANPPSLYEEFRKRPSVQHQFQCAAANSEVNRVGDEEATIRWAKSYLAATGVEHSSTLTNAQYATLDALLKS